MRPARGGGGGGGVACVVSLFFMVMTSASIIYPATRFDPESTIDLSHTKASDPYQWLEGDVRTDQEVATWVKTQHDFGESILNNIAGDKRQEFADGMRAVLDGVRIASACFAGGRWFVQLNEGLQDFAVWYWTQDMDLDEILQNTQDGHLWAASNNKTEGGSFSSKELKVLLDPNDLSEDKSVALASVDISTDGNVVLYQLQKSGSDWTTMYLKRYNSVTEEYENDLNHVIEWLKFTKPQWDDSGVYFTRYDKPPQEDQIHQAISANPRIVFYEFATKKEMEIFRDSEFPSYNLDVALYPQSTQRYLVIVQFSSAGTTPSRIFIQDRFAGLSSRVYPVYNDFNAYRDVVGVMGSKLYVRTDDQAPRYRIVSKVISKPELAEQAEQVEVVSQSNDSGRAIQSAHLLFDGTIVMHNNLHVRDEVQMFNSITGKLISDVQLPGIGTTFLFNRGLFIQGGLYYSFSSLHMNNVIYKYDAWTGKHIKLYEPPSPFNADDSVVEQVFVPSKDGKAKIPAFISHKKGLQRDGSNPTLIYGYGGFSVALRPTFIPWLPAWQASGGIYVQASIRGGGEYGRDWHQAALRERRQTAFDDFIAVAEYLIAQKYTSAKHLGIEGASNGGLLVGACMTQRPDLFGAVAAHVGVLDMMRYHKFTAGTYWMAEYGDPETPGDYEFLIKYSPYHKVLREGPRRYPATLILTADTDDRVVPSHSFKFLAALQTAQSEPSNPIIARLETKAGHGAGLALTKYIAKRADVLSFLFHFLSSTGNAATVNMTAKRHG